MCVYVNKHGECGPHLDRKLMLQLPDHFGPGPVNTVLQHAVQACVDCAYQPKTLFSFLQSQSDGGEIIRGRTVCVCVGVGVKHVIKSKQSQYSRCAS